MQMPYMDGIQLAESIREQYPLIPLILLSSVGDEYNKQNLELFSAILTKPIKQHVLSKHILCGLQPQHKPCSEEKTAQNKLSADFAARYPLNILVAEDNLINQQVILHILGKLGYEPTTVADGQEAVAEASGTLYDIILMDMQMPEMDGLEATRLIRKTLPHQPVIIALTANTMQGDEDECLKAGMNDYLAKPIKLEELVTMLVKWSDYINKSAQVA